MVCSIAGIPEYLHFTENKKIYSSKKFRFYHLLFITGFKGNPIEFPQTLTAISVCWSKLIVPRDVLNVVHSIARNPASRGNHVFFGRVKKIRKFKIKGIYDHNEFSGLHTLSTTIIHSPIECNYSHAEILIKHTYKERNESKVETVTKEQYDNKECLLRRKSHKKFFAPLLLQYRAKMATHLNSDISELNVAWYYRILPKNLVVSLSLWRAVNLSQQ